MRLFGLVAYHSLSLIVCVLVMSDGKPISSMTYQTTVYLSICYTIANIALNFALCQAITVAWWVKALNPGTTVKDLHHIWSYGTNMADILLAGRYFNLVALAGLLVTLVPINGPLLQRSSVLRERTKIEHKNISVSVAQYMLPGYTGWLTARGNYAGNVEDDFGTIINEYTGRKSMNISNSGCEGTCKGHVLGAGHAVLCNNDTVPFNASFISRNGSTNIRSAGVFSIQFQFDEQNEGNITFYAIFLSETFRGASGFVNRTTCTLQPATISYPITIINNTISLDPSSSWMTDRVERLRPEAFQDHGISRSRSTHGGLALYFRSIYDSLAVLRHDPIVGMQVSITGPTIFEHIKGIDANGMDTNHIGITFRSPTFDILSAVREVAFRTAIRMPISNTSKYFDDYGTINQTEQRLWTVAATQLIQAEQASTEIVYKSQYTFLIIAVALTLFTTLSVLIIFNGWWHIGRNVSLSPIEIARAFAAPLLINSDSNSNVGVLLKQVGNEGVRWGAATDHNIEYDALVTTLRFDSPDKCEQPQHGQIFGR